MRIRTLLLSAIAAVAIATPVVTATATTAAPAPKGTPIAPCEKAKTAKDNAGFMCDLIFVPKDKTKAVVAKIEASPSMEAALADPSLATATTLATAAGGEGGTCSLSGCYQWFTNIHSGYDAVGSYGWRYSSGAYQRIGTITWAVDDYLTTAYAVNTNMCWTTTHSAPGVYLIGEMYWATTGGANGELLPNRRRGVSTTSTVLANAKPGKCYRPYLNDNTRAIYLTYHYVSWQAAGFPGKWWAYNKSWIYGKEAGTALRFYSPVKYGAYANDAEWQPTL